MKQKNVVLMVVAVGCGLVAAFLTTQINAKPKIEMVEVLVASKNLPVGTMLSKAELPNLVARKQIAKDALPAEAFAMTEEDLVDKRLNRSIGKDAIFPIAGLAKGGVVTLPDGMDMVSFSVSAVDAAGGFVGPGSKVDVLARINLENTIEVFPLLIDMHVLAVNTHVDYRTQATFADISMVSVAVTQEQALLLELAKQRSCHLSLLLRHEGKPLDKNYDMKKIKKMLETDKSKTVFAPSTTGQGDNPDRGGTKPPETTTPTPTPTVKIDMVKVFVAVEEIAPNTSITGDLIKDKFKEKEFPKEAVEGACTDLTQYLGKSFKFGVAKGGMVTQAMVGEQAVKPPPQDHNIDNPPKPGLDTKPDVVAAPPKIVPPAKRIHDVAVHTASGTVVHRFQEVQPGDWKQIAVLTPEEAAKPYKEAAKATDKDSATTPSGKKIE